MSTATESTLVSRLREILERQYEAERPQTDNCGDHKAKPLPERSIDCPMCAADMRTMMLAALKANQWLCQWQEDAMREIREVIAGLEDKANTLRSEPDAAMPDDHVALQADVAEATLARVRNADATLSSALNQIKEAAASVAAIKTAFDTHIGPSIDGQENEDDNDPRTR